MNNRKDIGLLIARIIVGGIFILTGWIKVSDMAGTVAYFGQLGFAPFLAYIVGYAELLGGIALILGLWTCVMSIVLGIIVIVAAYASRGAGFQGVMPPVAVLASLIILSTSCGGKYSVKKCDCCNDGVKSDDTTPAPMA
ncbi:MAG: hypothetical protein COV01_01135 [Candidatus Taylorbacteria bacterium CG10_big_fil_rev_8_21_14_0_10_41_48]|uniref:DoxX family protein n=1 Tax=Candidatus Taylorbacteria bacterium CG10_big_fil_rev_8_21_14_0_10_41_48 TaxID=1975024 RepID=A0A2M8LDB6_9BACT|nr:MAG: hypothetical protein COV01_01135 [Candidatus Taylorbacteria bacterium CG10_big_fil_rev_8_21_14_0_10_41_48]